MWVRWTIPRFRYDQLMKLGWQILIPLGLLNIFLSHYEGVKTVAPSPETDVNVDFPIQIQ